MARVTVEDCLKFVENRFALVHASAKRAKQIFKGSQPRVICDNREIVTALREIADAKVEIKEIPLEADAAEKKKYKTKPKRNAA